MKKISIIISLFVLISSCNGNEHNNIDTRSKNSKTANQQKLKRYEIESGIIKYKTITSGKLMGSQTNGSGMESLYFKNWGALELKEEESNQTTITKIFGKKSEDKTNSHTISKLDNGESYHVDFDKKSIYLRRDGMMDLMMQTNTDASKTGTSMLESIGAKKIGQETFLGYNCDIWEIPGGKQWMYKGVVLKLEVSIMGITTLTEATSAKFNVDVPDKYFELPNFPVIKEEGYMDNEAYDEEMENMDDNIDALKSMSYEDWKKIATENDEEMSTMSETELRETYDMIQKMLNMRN